jgi:ketosteroid isomerase-like protein
MAGQTPAPGGSTLDVVNRFNDAINRHDAAAVTALLSDDTVFENTGPAPDGTRVEGKAAVSSFWEKWLVANADARFEAEDVVVAGDRCTVEAVAPARHRRLHGAWREGGGEALLRQGIGSAAPRAGRARSPVARSSGGEPDQVLAKRASPRRGGGPPGHYLQKATSSPMGLGTPSPVVSRIVTLSFTM